METAAKVECLGGAICLYGIRALSRIRRFQGVRVEGADHFTFVIISPLHSAREDGMTIGTSARLLAAVFGALIITAALVGSAAAQAFSRGNALVNESAYAIDREQWRQGVDLANEALRSNELLFENIPAAYNNLCIALTGLREFDNAIGACNKAVDMRPRQWSFYNNRANIFFYLGQYDRALAEYYKAMTFNSGGHVLMNNIGLTLQYRKSRGGAIVVDERAS